MKTGEPVRVVGLSGSLRQGSTTRMTVALALSGAAESGADTTLIDLRELDLPFCGREEGGRPEDVSLMRQAVSDARGLILGSPEYHGSLSGVMKNALDLMGSDELSGKIVGLVGVSGGRMGAAGALATLRHICRSVHAWVIPHQASVPQARNVYDSHGGLPDDDLCERLMDVGRQVTRYARLHHATETLEVLKRLEDESHDQAE